MAKADTSEQDKAIEITLKKLQDSSYRKELTRVFSKLALTSIFVLWVINHQTPFFNTYPKMAIFLILLGSYGLLYHFLFVWKSYKLNIAKTTAPDITKKLSPGAMCYIYNLGKYHPRCFASSIVHMATKNILTIHSNLQGIELSFDKKQGFSHLTADEKIMAQELSTHRHPFFFKTRHLSNVEAIVENLKKRFPQFSLPLYLLLAIFISTIALAATYRAGLLFLVWGLAIWALVTSFAFIIAVPRIGAQGWGAFFIMVAFVVILSLKFQGFLFLAIPWIIYQRIRSRPILPLTMVYLLPATAIFLVLFSIGMLFYLFAEGIFFSFVFGFLFLLGINVFLCYLLFSHIPKPKEKPLLEEVVGFQMHLQEALQKADVETKKILLEQNMGYILALDMRGQWQKHRYALHKKLAWYTSDSHRAFDPFIFSQQVYNLQETPQILQEWHTKLKKALHLEYIDPSQIIVKQKTKPTPKTPKEEISRQEEVLEKTQQSSELITGLEIADQEQETLETSQQSSAMATHKEEEALEKPQQKSKASSQEIGTYIAASNFASLNVNFAFAAFLPTYTSLSYGDLLTLEGVQSDRTLHILHYHAVDALQIQIHRNYYKLNNKVYGGQISSPEEFIKMSKLVRYVELLAPFDLALCTTFPERTKQVRILKSKFIRERHLAELFKFTNLKFLDLQEALISGRGFAKKTKWKKLIALNLSKTLIDNEGLSYLPELPELKYIDLSYTKVYKDGLKELARFPKLKYINLEKNQIEVSCLEKLSDLQSLNLNSTDLTSKDLENLTAFSKLQNLYLNSNQINTNNLAFIARLKKLKELSLQKTNIDNSSLQHLASLSQLSSLNISKTSITDQGLEFLSNTKLTKLNLHGNHLGTGSNIAKFEKLQELNLTETTLKNDFCFLEKLENLTLVNLQNTNVEDKALKAIGKLKKLKALNLRMTNVKDPHISHLEQLSQLQFLYLSATQISNKSIKTLSNFLNLSILDIRYTKIGLRGLYQLKQALPDCQILYSWWNIAL